MKSCLLYIAQSEQESDCFYDKPSARLGSILGSSNKLQVGAALSPGLFVGIWQFGTRVLSSFIAKS